MYLSDYHTHCSLSFDSKTPVEDMVRAGIAQGLQEMCLTDHVDLFRPRETAHWEHDFSDRAEIFARADKAADGKITVRRGIELGEAMRDFFDFSECLSSLVESQHLTLSDDGLYAITEKGAHNGAICESSLPYSVRLRADKNITIYNQKLKRRAQIKSDIEPRRNGTYTVTLAFNDDDEQPLLKMEMMVPKEVMAKDLAERFQKNPEQLYSGILNTLFAEPDGDK